MNISNRLIGPCSVLTSDNQDVQLDVQTLIHRLILFDTYILVSPNLKEIPHLVQVFGFEGVLKLLSGPLRIRCECCVTAQVGQSELLRGHKKVLPINSYSILYGYATDYWQWVSDGLQNAWMPGLSKKEVKKLKQAIVNALEKPIQAHDMNILEQTNIDLASNSCIKQATKMAIHQKLGIDINPDIFSIRLHQIEQGDFELESNIGEILNLDEQEVHKLIEQAILAIANLNQRLKEMEVYNALSGFQNKDYILLVDKLKFLIQDFNSQQKEKNISRIFKIKNFPEIGYNITNNINIDKLLEIRKTKECKDFREWLTRIDDFRDTEIAEQVNSLSSKLGILAHSPVGKVLRIIAPMTTNLIPEPIISNLASLSLGSIDSFLIDKVLPYSGAIAFINNLYPSIFEHKLSSKNI